MTARPCTNKEVMYISQEIQKELTSLYDANRQYIGPDGLPFKESPDQEKIKELRSAAEALKAKLILGLAFNNKSKSFLDIL